MADNFRRYFSYCYYGGGKEVCENCALKSITLLVCCCESRQKLPDRTSYSKQDDILCDFEHGKPSTATKTMFVANVLHRMVALLWHVGIFTWLPLTHSILSSFSSLYFADSNLKSNRFDRNNKCYRYFMRIIFRMLVHIFDIFLLISSSSFFFFFFFCLGTRSLLSMFYDQKQNTHPQRVCASKSFSTEVCYCFQAVCCYAPLFLVEAFIANLGIGRITNTGTLGAHNSGNHILHILRTAARVRKS